MIIRRNAPLCGATNTVDGRPCRNTVRGCPIAAHKTPEAGGSVETLPRFGHDPRNAASG